MEPGQILWIDVQHVLRVNLVARLCTAATAMSRSRTVDRDQVTTASGSTAAEDATNSLATTCALN